MLKGCGSPSSSSCFLPAADEVWLFMIRAEVSSSLLQKHSLHSQVAAPGRSPGWRCHSSSEESLAGGGAGCHARGLHFTHPGLVSRGWSFCLGAVDRRRRAQVLEEQRCTSDRATTKSLPCRMSPASPMLVAWGTAPQRPCLLLIPSGILFYCRAAGTAVMDSLCSAVCHTAAACFISCWFRTPSHQ